MDFQSEEAHRRYINKLMRNSVSKIKYGIHPGYIRSRIDGDIHWISATKLMQLYEVNPDECIVIYKNRPDLVRSIGLDLGKLIHLYPRYDGNYNLK